MSSGSRPSPGSTWVGRSGISSRAAACRSWSPSKQAPETQKARAERAGLLTYNDRGGPEGPPLCELRLESSERLLPDADVVPEILVHVLLRDERERAGD